MGSLFSPVDLPEGLVDRSSSRSIRPVLRTMAADGNPYTGFIYAGLALTAAAPR
jgi:phosphoribosylamine-glycine ligase